jgi:uncharacterized membrane protein (UPF0127 family)
MRFPVDVVFLDRWGWPIEIRRAVEANRVVACKRAAAVLEMAAGSAARHFVVVKCAAHGAGTDHQSLARGL